MIHNVYKETLTSRVLKIIIGCMCVSVYVCVSCTIIGVPVAFCPAH